MDEVIIRINKRHVSLHYKTININLVLKSMGTSKEMLEALLIIVRAYEQRVNRK